MAKKQQSRAQAKAASKSRPAAVGSSSASSSSSSSTPAITAFSPSSPHFAILTQAIDRHRLSVYQTSSPESRLLVDYVLPTQSGNSSEAAKCSALTWISLPVSASAAENDDHDDGDDEDGDDPKAKRQKKKGKQNGASSPAKSRKSTSPRTKPAIALGLESGSIDIFDIAQGKITRVLSTRGTAGSAASSVASGAITSLTTAASSSRLYATTKDGVVRVWDLHVVSNAAESTVAVIEPAKLIKDSAGSSTARPSLLSLSPSGNTLLTASHTITSLDVSSSSSSQAKSSTYNAHASPLTHLTWLDGGDDHGDDHFVSAAQNDPVLYIWKASRSKSPVGTIELEQGQQVIRVEAKHNVVAVAGSQGFIGLYDVSSITSEAPKTTKVVKATSSSAAASALVDVRLSGTEAQRLDIATLVKSVKLELSSTEIKDPATLSLLSTLVIPKSSSASANLLSSDDSAQTKGISSLQRYSDPSSASGRQTGASQSAAVVGEDGMLVDGSKTRLSEDELNALNQDAGGVEDERSLEDRLRGLRVVKGGNRKARRNGVDDEGDNDDNVMNVDASSDDDEDDGQGRRATGPTTSLSLATSLSQALHSSDSSLLSSLLKSSNASLIKSTILRISGPNAVRLLEACVERLNGRKRGSQKARGMIEWIKWTLRLHAGYIMSLPGLTARLATLHSSLTSRLVAHDRLLALQGRLELVLSQIELRSEYDVVNTHGLQGIKSRGGENNESNKMTIEKEGKIWKEDQDESESEDAMEMDDDSDSDEDAISIDEQDEDGDVEDVGLDSNVNVNGGFSDDTDAEEDDDDAPRRSSRRKGKTNSTSLADTSIISGVATSDESDSEDDDDDDDDDDDEDESDLEDDFDDDSDEDEDEDGQGGLIDDEAEEGTEESEEDSEGE